MLLPATLSPFSPRASAAQRHAHHDGSPVSRPRHGRAVSQGAERYTRISLAPPTCLAARQPVSPSDPVTAAAQLAPGPSIPWVGCRGLFISVRPVSRSSHEQVVARRGSLLIIVLDSPFHLQG